MKKMKEKVFLNVAGIRKYFGNIPFELGDYVTLEKEPENPYDSDAIAVFSEAYGKCGYVANSVNTVLRGTKSASRIYDRIEEKCPAKVVYSTFDNVILEIEVE